MQKGGPMNKPLNPQHTYSKRIRAKIDILMQSSTPLKPFDMGTGPQFEFEKHGINVEPIESELDQLVNVGIKEAADTSILATHTANERMDNAKNNPTPKMLFDGFWFEGELCILFADTNLGKSILAMQIGNSISKGEPIPGFKLEVNKRKVLLLDFELNDKQFENRYSNNYQERYEFDSNLFTSGINADSPIPSARTFEDALNASLERAIIETGAEVLIIDNIHYLINEASNKKEERVLMKSLRVLQSKHGLSILALAHTKKRDLSKPITRNDLLGSKMLINFCDSSFSIGESPNDKSLRYLKQIKSQNIILTNADSTVWSCRINKPHNFLMFEFLNLEKEQTPR
jgi:hypothetical protein